MAEKGHHLKESKVEKLLLDKHVNEAMREQERQMVKDISTKKNDRVAHFEKNYKKK